MKDQKLERVTFRLTEAEKNRIIEVAAARGIKVSQLIRELCEEIFKEETV